MKDTFKKFLDNYEQMKSVAYTYPNKRECSIQECVYYILSGDWLRKNSLVLNLPTVIFLQKDAEY